MKKFEHTQKGSKIKKKEDKDKVDADKNPSYQ